MENNLASNIRTFRKERGLTQEKLAEAFGVTVGAVHKWEAGISVPDLSIILEMADFFDTSLDVLIGFEARDNRISVLAGRLRKMAYTMDPKGPSEAEKALKKYPHNFAIVFECALIYAVYGISPMNRKYLTRSVELFEQSITLISQNTDPSLNETLIYGQLAIVHQTMGDTKKALEIYKAHNAGGMFDIRIGKILASSGDYKEADKYLSGALVKQLGDKMILITGKLQCYLRTGNYEEARVLIEAGLSENSFYRKDDKPNALDKMDCFYLTALSFIELKTGHKKKAKDLLIKAKRVAERFDEAPDHDVKNLRFISISESMMLRDTLGDTCMDAIGNTITILKAKELEKIWSALIES